jgi:hypothetical protein
VSSNACWPRWLQEPLLPNGPPTVGGPFASIGGKGIQPLSRRTR